MFFLRSNGQKNQAIREKSSILQTEALTRRFGTLTAVDALTISTVIAVTLGARLYPRVVT